MHHQCLGKMNMRMQYQKYPSRLLKISRKMSHAHCQKQVAIVAGRQETLNPLEQCNPDSGKIYAQKTQKKPFSWDIKAICNFIRENKHVQNLISHFQTNDSALEHVSQEARVIGSYLNHLRPWLTVYQNTYEIIFLVGNSENRLANHEQKYILE